MGCLTFVFVACWTGLLFLSAVRFPSRAFDTFFYFPCARGVQGVLSRPTHQLTLESCLGL